MNKCKFIQPVHPEIKFGVDLTELFPAWYLHPALKNLIYLAEINIRRHNGSRFQIEHVLGKNSNGEGSIKSRLELKNLLIHGKNILNQNVAPGVPIWLIRHFLGLLPTPIFPPKCDEHYWYNFTTRYYEQFVDSIKKRRASNEFIEDIGFELSHLPARNLTFLFEFFEMIRFLSMSSMNDVLDKRAVIMLAKYFTPSLMIRPYRPGTLTKDVRKYVIFITFCVYFWSDLHDKIHNYLKTTLNKNSHNFFYYPENYKYEVNNYSKNNGTQTDLASDLYLNIQSSSDENLDNFHCKKNIKKESLIKLKSVTPSHENMKLNDFESMESIQETCILKSSTPKRKEKQSLLLQNLNTQNFNEYYETIKRENCKFLRTVCTQTDASSDSNHVSITSKSKICPPKLSVKYNSRIKTPKRKKKIETHDIIVLEIPRYRRKNNLKNAKLLTCKRCKLQTSNIKQNVIQTKMNIDEEYFSTKNKSEEKLKTPNCSIVTYDWSINSIINNGEYVYDSYIGNYYDETPYQPTKTFPVDNTSCASINNDILINNSDVRTYYDVTKTPFKPTKLFSEDNTPSDKTKMGFIEPPSNNTSIDLYKRITQYGWTYNPSISLSSIEQDEPYVLCYDNDQKSVHSLNSLTPLTEKNKKKKTSFLNISRKFSFFKKFTNSAKKTMSYTDINSNVKYEKIAKSANSI